MFRLKLLLAEARGWRHVPRFASARGWRAWTLGRAVAVDGAGPHRGGVQARGASAPVLCMSSAGRAGGNGGGPDLQSAAAAHCESAWQV
eukprot:tig00001535_g9288.t1